MKAEQLQELYTKVENYANHIFGIETRSYIRSFRLEKGYIEVYDKAYCDSTDDLLFLIYFNTFHIFLTFLGILSLEISY